jgi:hypothetical protein
MRISLKLAASFAVLATLVGAVRYFSGRAQREVERELEYVSRSAIVNLADAATMSDALSAAQNSAHDLLRDARRVQTQPALGVDLGRPTRHPRDTHETLLRHNWISLSEALSGVSWLTHH